MDKRTTSEAKKIKLHYDSLADELFLPHVDIKVPINTDSVKIDFLTKEDFELVIDIRKLCQVVSDSIGLRFRIENYNIRDFGELEIDKQIIEYDTSLFPLVINSLKQKDKRIFDSLRQRIGVSPATIINFHNKADRYFTIIKRDNLYEDNKRHLIITYYVSELIKFPYPKTLFRLFVNDKNEVIDSGTHRNYDKKIDYEKDGQEQATASIR